MVAVAVGAIIHDLAVEDLPQRVYLPEDDTAVTRAAQVVAADGLLHLHLGQVAIADQCPAEVAVGRLSLLPHRPTVTWTVVTQLMPKGLKRMRK